MSRKDALVRKLYGRMPQNTSLPGVSLTEIVDDRRVLIENHHGILGYGPTEIRVSVHNGVNCIEGSQLELICIAKDKIVITGQIECVRFCRGGARKGVLR